MTTDTTVLDGLDFPTPALAVADDVADLLFREARTVAEFVPGEVTDEQLAAVYDLVKWGPTAMNTLPAAPARRAHPGGPRAPRGPA